MLTKNKSRDENRLYRIYVIYNHTNNQDIELPDIGLRRFNFGLPYIEKMLLEYDDYIKFLQSCCQEFVEECVFDDKYFAYKKWQELLCKKAEEINDFLGV